MGGFTERSLYIQVNRVIHDTILASPLIQHKIDLFLAGLEYNAAAGVDLIESRKAYLQYTGSSLDSLRPIEEKVVDVAQAEPGYPSSTVGGVHAVFADSVRLFSLGSASRGIPHKEWEIPSPIDDPIGRYIYPRANLIAFVERQTNTCVHQSPEPQSRAHSNAAAVAYRSEFIYAPCQMVVIILQLNSQQSNTRGQIPGNSFSTPFQ